MAKHLLDFQDLSKKEIEKLIESTQKIDINSMKQTNSLSLLKFDEPSTRTDKINGLSPADKSSTKSY